MSIGEGDHVWTGDGRRLLLGRLVKSGGAGSVHLLRDDPSVVAKLYHAHVNHKDYERKVAAMLALTPELPDLFDGAQRYVQIAWPSALLRDARGRFIGFAMPALDVAATSELELVMMERQARAAGLPTGLGAKVTLAANLAAVIAELHRRHHYVVDLKPVNLRFYRRSLYMAMLDCDGFSIQGQGERFRAPQFTLDYLAPEFQKQGLREAGEEMQDRFAMAVIVFQLLNFGIHPYSGKPASQHVPTDIPGRIAGNWYAYGLRPDNGIRPNPSSGHAAIPDALRQLFDRAFGRDSASRPSAEQWAVELRAYATRSSGHLVACAQRAAHQHFSGHACAACAREALIAGAQARQRARPRLPQTPLARVHRQVMARRRPVPLAQHGAVTSQGRAGAGSVIAAYAGAVWSRVSWYKRFQMMGFGFLLLFLGLRWLGEVNVPKANPYRPPQASSAPATQPVHTPVRPQAVTTIAVPTQSQIDSSANANAALARRIGTGAQTLASATPMLREKAAPANGASAWAQHQYDAALTRFLAQSTEREANASARKELVTALADIVERDPLADEVMFELGWTRLLDGRVEQARGDFARALAVNPLNAEAWYGFGVSANNDAEMIGALAVAETIAATPSAAEYIRRRFQSPTLTAAGIDTRGYAVAQARARRLALVHLGEPVPQEIEALASRALSRSR